MNDTHKLAVAVIVSVLVCSSIALGYQFYREQQLKEEFDGKLALSEQTLSAQIALTRQNLSLEVEKLALDVASENAETKQELDSQLRSLGLSLNVSLRKSQRELETISGKLDEVEAESKEKIVELEDRLKNVNVKSSDFSGIIKDVVKSVVSVKTNSGQGSGVVIDAGGYIVTNYHVVSGADQIAVFFYDKTGYYAQIVGYNAVSDIAVLKVELPSPPDSLKFGNSESVSIGERVIAVGNPGGLDFTVTEGIISATNRVGQNGVAYLQTDVPINPGNSGGPLVGTSGRIIGINTLKIGGFEGIGFAVPSNTVKDIATDIIEKHKASLGET